MDKETTQKLRKWIKSELKKQNLKKEETELKQGYYNEGYRTEITESKTREHSRDNATQIADFYSQEAQEVIHQVVTEWWSENTMTKPEA